MAETILSAPTNQAASPPHTLTARRGDQGASMQQLIYFREILRYVPQYRDKVFVIALDGAIVSDPNFQNLLLDIALLRSLSIGVVLVHGAGHQILQLADQTGQNFTNLDGTGVTDEATLQLAITAATQVTHRILEGLSATDLNGASSNALVAHPAGILQGVNHQFTGRVERVNDAMLRSLLANDVIPVVPPLGMDGEGHTYRLNSDAVAVELAIALSAVKLIYLSTIPGILLKRANTEELLRQIKVDEAENILRKHRQDLVGPSMSKLTSAVKALNGKVPRVHIIDGRVEEGLLAEVFSNDGIGTLIHTNEYQAIRPAQKKDVRALYSLIKKSVENDELLPRSMAEIERHLGDYFVFEIDGLVAACIALHPHAAQAKAEMACVCVAQKYENQGIGGRLMGYLEDLARERGVQALFCLSTQAVNYFVKKGGFRLGTPDDLPPLRRQRYDNSGRKSQVLVKQLA